VFSDLHTILGLRQAGGLVLDDALKRTLLERKFRIIEYMEEMRSYHQQAIDALIAALQHIYNNPPKGADWKIWPQADRPGVWEERALRNIQGTHKSVERGITNAKAGNFSTIRNATGSLQGIFGNLTNMSWKWWGYIDPSYKDTFTLKLAQAEAMASNVRCEIGGYWRIPGSMLDEEITGPIDEQDLLRYLKPGENP